MPSKLNPYLHFAGTTREAMEFYKSVFGGELILNTYKDSHVSQDPSEDDRIMHASLVADNGFTIFAADPPQQMELNAGNTMVISLSGDDEEALTGYYEKLSAGGTVTMPLAKAMWGDTFGMFTDRFGVAWMVNIAGEKLAA